MHLGHDVAANEPLDDRPSDRQEAFVQAQRHLASHWHDLHLQNSVRLGFIPRHPWHNLGECLHRPCDREWILLLQRQTVQTELKQDSSHQQYLQGKRTIHRAAQRVPANLRKLGGSHSGGQK